MRRTFYVNVILRRQFKYVYGLYNDFINNQAINQFLCLFPRQVWYKLIDPGWMEGLTGLSRIRAKELGSG